MSASVVTPLVEVAADDAFAAEHAAIAAVEAATRERAGNWYSLKLGEYAEYKAIADAGKPQSTRLLRAAVERLRQLDEHLAALVAAGKANEPDAGNRANHARFIARTVAEAMLRRKLPASADDYAAVARYVAAVADGQLHDYRTPITAIGKLLCGLTPEVVASSKELADALDAMLSRLRDPAHGNALLADKIARAARPPAATAAAAAHPFAGPAGEAAAELIVEDDSAMRQLRAFRRGQPLDALGPTERVGPDGYPMLADSPLRVEHERIGGILDAEQRASRHDDETAAALRKLPAVATALKADDAARTRFVLALLERCFAFDAKLSEPEGGPHAHSSFYDYGTAARAIGLLIDAGVELPRVVMPVLDWFTSYRFPYYGTPPVLAMLKQVAVRLDGRAPPAALRDSLIEVRGQCSDLGHYSNHGAAVASAVDALLGEGPWLVLAPAEHWAAEATAELAKLDAAPAAAWLALLRHAATATAARPTAKWLAEGRKLLKAVGDAAVRDAMLRWFPRVDAGRLRPMVGVSWENVDERQRMHESNGTVLRGLLWLAPDVATPDVTRAVARLTASAYRKIRGVGPRATKVGNACVYALSAIGNEAAVGQLALLKVKVKFGTAQKEIEKAFDAAAIKLGLPRDEIEELGVPTYGMDAVGLRRETFGEGDAAVTATLTVDGKDVALAWTRADGKALKSVPAKVKSEFKEELKELQLAAKDAGAMVAAQAERIDGLFLAQRTWPIAAWRERYLDHPLVGTVARRLIWLVGGVACIWHDGKLVDAADRAIEPADDATVELWHPMARPEAEVLAFRAWLTRHEVRQPFKQAHREVYPLTDAERRTNTYSNRFAAHVIRQHQFNALCAARGWKHKLRLMVDDTYPPASKLMPQWDLRAEYWVEGIGDGYGTDTAESGAYLRLATDQVRFYRTAAAINAAHAGGGGYTTEAPGPGAGDVNAPLPLDQVPPLVLSEVLRDVDLFVGVASVGNDPTWQDGGPEGRYREYWQSYSFGELGESAKTRRAVLETLLPRLTKLKGKWTLEERFLVVRGSLRTYKIHLGSGNILMEPNDQYLCIVPDRSSAARDGDVFLPFEGDATLSIILSKAFLLADDGSIADATITRQIAGR